MKTNILERVQIMLREKDSLTNLKCSISNFDRQRQPENTCKIIYMTSIDYLSQSKKNKTQRKCTGASQRIVYSDPLFCLIIF